MGLWRAGACRRRAGGRPVSGSRRAALTRQPTAGGHRRRAAGRATGGGRQAKRRAAGVEQGGQAGGVVLALGFTVGTGAWASRWLW